VTTAAVPETENETTSEIPAVTGTAPAAAGPDRPVIGAESAPVSAAEYARTWADVWRKNWIPPQLWTHGRPSLKASWLWATRGEHLPEDEPVRHASRAGTGALLPFRALFLYLDWIFERWSRVIAAAVLVLAIVQMIHPMF
jgi:hypothetical protein